MTKRKPPAPRTAKSKSKTTNDPAPVKWVYQSEVQKILASSPPKKGRSRKRETAKTLGVYDADRDILDQYLHEVSLTPLLTTPQEIAIAKLVRAGNQEAMQELVKRNLRFVISVAKKYQNRGLLLTDLIGEGNVWACSPRPEVRSRSGVKFISYAVWWIRQAILASLRPPGPHRPGAAQSYRRPLAHRAHGRDLRQDLRREPMPEETAKATGLSPEVVQSLAALNTSEVRLDAPLDPEGDRSLIERFIADDQADTEEEAMDRFPDRRDRGRALDPPAPGCQGAPALLRAGRRPRAYAGRDRRDARRHPRESPPAAGPRPQAPARGRRRSGVGEFRGVVLSRQPSAIRQKP
jgi:RNA polymerase primary sigma factor